MMYADFARVYDRLMDDFDYPAWARYALALLRRAGVEPKNVCECGCGTGSMTLELLRAGLSVTASDLSCDMLRVAADKLRAAGLRAPLVCQDMRALKLHKPVDAVVAFCDAVNYLAKPSDARAFFVSAHEALSPGGVLLFDVSTREKLEGELGDAFFGEERDDVAYLWKNATDRERHVTRMELTFFVRRKDGLYERFEETHVQRGHSEAELRAWLTESGFADVRAYGETTFSAPEAGQKRMHVTAKRA